MVTSKTNMVISMSMKLYTNAKAFSRSLHWYFGDPFFSDDELLCLSKVDFMLNRVLHLTQLKISPCSWTLETLADRKFFL